MILKHISSDNDLYSAFQPDVASGLKCVEFPQGDFSAIGMASGRAGILFCSGPFVPEFLSLYTKKGRSVKWKSVVLLIVSSSTREIKRLDKS